MKNPELAYIAYNGNIAIIDTLDLATGVAHGLPGTENVSFFAWSPDGQQIAFISQRALTDNPLYIMSADGHDKRRVAEVGFINKSPWSPDGQQLVFIQRPQDRFQVSILPTNADQPQSLYDDSDGDVSPLWSADGQYVAFLAQDGTYLVIKVISKNGKLQRELAGLGNQDYVWSPRGHWLAYVQEYGIHIFDPERDTDSVLTESTVPDAAMSWSPDGTSLAYIDAENRQGRVIVVASVDGSHPKQIIADIAGGSFGPLAWTADGQSMAFSAYFPPDTNTEIYLAHLNGETQRLTFNKTVDWLPSWRP